DCGHGSFTASPMVNKWLGRVCSLLTFVPYKSWAMEHNVHHSQFGGLGGDRTGEVDLMTVTEYRNARWWQRAWYRAYRHPLFVLFVAPYGLFVLRFRLSGLKNVKAQRSALLTNVALLAGYGAAFWLMGWPGTLVLMLSLYIGAAVGVMLFYLQHV